MFPECLPGRLVAIAKVCDLMWFEDGNLLPLPYFLYQQRLISSRLVWIFCEPRRGESLHWTSLQELRNDHPVHELLANWYKRNNWRENIAGFASLLGYPRQSLKAEPRYMQFVTGMIMEWLERDDEQSWLRLLGSLYDNFSIMTNDPTDAMTFEEYKSVRWIHSGSM